MAQLHLKSGAGNVSPYVDWTNAATTLAAAIAAMAAGDTLAVSSAHAEATAGISLTIPGSATTVSKILGGTQGTTSGLSALAGGCVIESTNTSFSVPGSFYASHITWRASSTSTVSPTFASTTGDIQYHNACRYEVTGAGATSGVKFGAGTAGAGTLATVKDGVFKFSHALQRISIDHCVVMQGCSFDTGGTAPSGLFKLSGNTRSARLLCDDLDASFCTSAMDVITSTGQGAAFARFRRMKMPATWTGNLITAGQAKAGDRFELIDYSVGATKYKLLIADYAGTLKDESTVKITANSRSYKATTASVCGRINPLRSHEYFVPLVSGSAQTISLAILTDNVTLTDGDAWLEVDYFAGSNSIGTTVTDAAADALATPANQATSSATWTTTGITTPVKQSLSVTVTPGAADYAIVRAVFAKPSTTVLLDDRVAVA